MRLFLLGLALAVSACSDPKYSVEELQDPNTCNECHPKHFEQWSGSMHAYAADDPVFLAMNKRGQRETNGELGDFCVQCHAPMAIALGEASGANIDQVTLSPSARGITCYFCHNVDEVTSDHNNGLRLAMDQTMRGGLKGAIDNPAHHVEYDEMMASKTNNSTMCGSCHDVITPAGVHIERTFAEWKDTVFANVDPTNLLPLTCSGCHMFPTTEPIAKFGGAPEREYGFHEHALPGIDQALTPFPQMEQQAALIQRDMDAALKIVGLRPLGSRTPYGGICTLPDGTFTVRIDTINVGHMFPSGAAHDRRSWIQVKAFDAGGGIVFQSGVVPEGSDPEDINDPYVNCTMAGNQGCSGFWDRTFKADGKPAHFFWEVATLDSKLLKPQTTFDQNAPGYDHSTTVKYLVGPSLSQAVRIEAQLFVRAMPYEVIDDLIASGDLDPVIRGRFKTLTSSSATKTWEKATASTGLAANTGQPGVFGCSPN